jgi:hypothetical protein
VKTEVDARLRQEAERFSLRFTCEHCAYFDEPRSSCALGYPNEAHRSVNLAAVETLFFCKEFEHH